MLSLLVPDGHGGHLLRPHDPSPSARQALSINGLLLIWLTHLVVNPLTGEHVLVSPHRTKRPWLGQTEPPQQAHLPEYDPKCYLCPGNSRAGGEQNEKYEHTMVFENDFAAVLPPPGPTAPPAPHPLLTTEPVQGGCDVICFHPRHDLTLARLPLPDIERVIHEWCAVYKKRGAQDDIKYVQIFEVMPVVLCRA